ncbi:DUF4350 domain-containing protein [Homoserinimonas hongtaonis]|uniref:DUF4350 domain-containing protein n=1 Tax=Homoserinimonas hongtaonis TaxID=2079791 RepID=UPI0011B26ADB|nr:DUF4350 domain-containing protein [Salinibacterium hongtaonis]
MSYATPLLRRTLRRWVFWVVLVSAALVFVLVTMIATGAGRPLGEPLHPESPGPEGTMAAVEVLRDHGVDVIVATSFEQMRAASADRDSTILVHDPLLILDDDNAARLLDVVPLARDLVLLDPSTAAVEAVNAEIAAAGSVSGVLSADCDLGPIVRAEEVTGDGRGYRYLGSDDSVVSCLDSGDDIVSVVQFDHGETTVSVVGATEAFTNGTIASVGNAALVFGLLGENPTLVWYIPGFADIASDEDPALSPQWTTPVVILLALVAVAAGVWRGRRLGPLVVENLPVTVRASETMEGRARLYSTSSARLRALDSLRIGTVQRLAGQCKLPRTADVYEVADTVAAITGWRQTDVRAVLVDAIPAHDRDLMELSDRLLELERAVATATTPT